MENPVPHILAMLEAIPTTKAAVFVMNDIYGKSLCVHPVDKSPFAGLTERASAPATNLQELHEANEEAPECVVISAGNNALFVAAVLGLIHAHNLGVQVARDAHENTMRIVSAKAAEKFIAQAIIDFHFGINFGHDVQAGGASGPARRSKYAANYDNESGFGGG